MDADPFTDRPMFQHKPLASSNQIRLVCIAPAQRRIDTLIGSMMPTTNWIFGTYTALSYSWATENGDDSPRQKMMIDGKVKWIGQNLFDALVQIRQQDQESLLWIDALCINQEDIAERNSQVQLMSRIYMYASEVVAWLGHSTPALDEAFFLFLSCVSESRSNGEHSVDGHVWTKEAQKDISSSSDICDTHEDLSLCDLLCLHETTLSDEPHALSWDLIQPLTQTVFNFLGRRFFYRRWVVQELLHSHGRAVFKWGTYTMTWETLMEDIPELCYRIEKRFPKEGGKFYHPGFRVDIGSRGTHMLKMWWSESFLDTLARCSKFECKDDRDRIYSLLALDAGKVRFDIKPDYSKSTREVYIDFSKHLIQMGCQDWLLYARDNSGPSQGKEDLNLPSWVIDLRYPIDTLFSHLLQSENQMTLSITEEGIVTYFPFCFGTCTSRTIWKPPYFVSLISLDQGQSSTVERGSGGEDIPRRPPSLYELKDALEESTKNFESESLRVEDPTTELGGFWWAWQYSKIERVGPVMLHRLVSESPIFGGLQDGDLIRGSTPELKSHDTVVHVLRKKDDAAEDVYTLYRAIPVHENMPLDHFLSSNVQALCRVKVRLV